MSSRDPLGREAEIRRLAGDWIAKADLDFDTVVRLLAEERFRDIKTHVIRRLLILLDPVEPGLAKELDDANWLSPFGAEIHHPGDRPQTVPGDEMRAQQLAQRVRGAVMAVLPRISRKQPARIFPPDPTGHWPLSTGHRHPPSPLC